MNKVQQQVHEFHRDVLGQGISPAEPMIRFGERRSNLILEEAIEAIVGLVGSRAAENLLDEASARLHHKYGEAPVEPNLIEAIDGLADLDYVLNGTAEEIGIDLEPFSDEVHRLNMTKKGGEFRADGKLIKPAWYSPADIAGVLARVTGLRTCECGKPAREGSMFCSDACLERSPL